MWTFTEVKTRGSKCVRYNIRRKNVAMIQRDQQNYVRIMWFTLARLKINDSDICLGAASIIDTAWVVYEGKNRSYIGRNFFFFNLHVANREIRRFLNDIGSVNGITKRNTTYVNYEMNQKKEKGQGGDRRKVRVQRSLKGFLFVRARTSACPPCENDASKSWKIATAVQAQGESL